MRLKASFAVLVLIGSLAVLTGGPAAGQDAPPAPGGGPEPAPTAPTEATPTGAEAAVTGVRAMVTGYYHSCALLTSGNVRCSGYNGYGELGDGTDDDRNRSVVVRNASNTGPLGNVVQLAAGDYFTCALQTNGQVRCWGYNGDGELGIGNTDVRHLPTTVKNPAGTGPLKNVAQISAGGSTACAVLRNGQVRCWGDNEYAQVGDGTDGNDRLRPKQVVAVQAPGLLTQVAQVEVGDYHVCARLTNRQVRCWGYGEYGELGDGTFDSSLRPVVVLAQSGTGPLTGVRRISASAYHSCAVLANSTARCWGYNNYGELGDDTDDERGRPVKVKNPGGTGPLTQVRYLDVGYYHSCALLTNGQVRCWGENQYDQIGNGIEAGPDVFLPTAVRNRLNTGNLTGVRQLQSTSYHTCVTLRNGQARCWGYDDYGAFGNGASDQSPLPVIFGR